MRKNTVFKLALAVLLFIPVFAFSDENNLKIELHKISEKLNSLEKERKNVCKAKEKYQKDIQELKTELVQLKIKESRLKQDLNYVDLGKYKELKKNIEQLSKKIKEEENKEKKYREKCSSIQTEIHSLKDKKLTVEAKIRKIQLEKLQKLLTREEWVEGEGTDILDIDETPKQCEEKSLKYAEQNAINTKYGIITSFVKSTKEININGKKIKVNKKFSDNLRNLVKVIKLEEKIIYKKREPIQIEGISTYICKTKVKLKVKGIVQKEEIELKNKEPFSTYNFSKKSVAKYKPVNHRKKEKQQKKKYPLAHLGFEANIGYAYSTYKFGKQKSKADTLSTNLGIGVGYVFFQRIFLLTGLGLISDEVKTDFNPNQIQQQ